MIGAPQNDLRHIGHVGYDGAIFGDVSSFIGDDYSKLPVKVGNPQSKLRYHSLLVIFDLMVVHGSALGTVESTQYLLQRWLISIRDDESSILRV
jgi:hypothetical protein